MQQQHNTKFMNYKDATRQSVSVLKSRIFKDKYMSCSRCLVEFSCKQTKVMFQFSVSNQNALCVSLTSNKHVKCISFLS